MAFNQRIAFEVDAATGNNANGGGFDDTTGVPGTNYAWGAGQTTIAYTDAVIGTPNTTATSVARPFTSADVGNVIKITAGTNWTTGRYQVLSVAAGVATFDRALGTIGGSGGTGTLGGSLATIQEGINAAFISAGAVADCRLYIKKGAYTGTVALTTSGSVAPSNRRCRILGYGTTHDDDPTPQIGNQPSYAVGSGAGVDALDIASSSGFWVQNITFDGTATSGTIGVKGINATAGSVIIVNCKIINFSSNGFVTNNGLNQFMYCEVTGCAGAAVFTNGTDVVEGCWVHKNTNIGITPGGNGITITNCLITNNSGGSSDGIQFGSGTGLVVTGCTIYGNGRDGINDSGTSINASGPVFRNNILAKNGRYGINMNGGSSPNRFGGCDYNAYYLNTTSNYNNLTAGDHDVVVSSNPFNSSDVNLAAETTPDWGLNSTVSAGAAIRATGYPGQMPGLTNSTGYRDIGLFQHQDSGGTGGTTTIMTHIIGG